MFQKSVRSISHFCLGLFNFRNVFSFCKLCIYSCLEVYPTDNCVFFVVDFFELVWIGLKRAYLHFNMNYLGFCILDSLYCSFINRWKSEWEAFYYGVDISWNSWKISFMPWFHVFSFLCLPIRITSMHPSSLCAVYLILHYQVDLYKAFIRWFFQASSTWSRTGCDSLHWNRKKNQKKEQATWDGQEWDQRLHRFNDLSRFKATEKSSTDFFLLNVHSGL